MEGGELALLLSLMKFLANDQETPETEDASAYDFNLDSCWCFSIAGCTIQED